MNEVTRILSAVGHGAPGVSAQLLPLVYEELKKLAAQKMVQESPGQTLQATALVHEAYVRLVGDGQNQTWDSRGHFFAAAAEAMRRILIDQARRRHSVKHGGNRQRVSLDEIDVLAAPEAAPADDLIALDEVLRQLEAEDPVKARLVQLRFFAGVPLDDAAQMLGISPATAKRYWVYARSWLYGKLHA